MLPWVLAFPDVLARNTLPLRQAAQVPLALPDSGPHVAPSQSLGPLSRVLGPQPRSLPGWPVPAFRDGGLESWPVATCYLLVPLYTGSSQDAPPFGCFPSCSLRRMQCTGQSGVLRFREVRGGQATVTHWLALLTFLSLFSVPPPTPWPGGLRVLLAQMLSLRPG